MNRTNRGLCIVLAMLGFVGQAAAEPSLVVQMPKLVEQPDHYDIELSADGRAQLRLTWAAPGDTAAKVGVELSALQGEGGAVIVGLGTASDGEFARSLRDVSIAPNGVELFLYGTALKRDVKYTGELSATVGDKVMRWKINVVRPGAFVPFSCPLGDQLVALDGSTAVDFPVLVPSNQRDYDLALSPFTTAQRELGTVGFSNPAGGPPVPTVKLKAASGTHFTPPIVAKALQEDTVYKGTLSFSSGGNRLLDCDLGLLWPKQARGELAIDTQTLTRTVTLPLAFGYGGDQDPMLRVRLFDKERSRRIDGLSVALDGTAGSPEGAFDLNRHIAFFVDSRPTTNIEGWPWTVDKDCPKPDASAGHLTVAPGQQLEVGMKLKDLEAGVYTFSLRFAGTKLSAEASKLDVTLNVRDHWFWAVFAVLVALATSFFVSKGIVNWRERVRLRRRVQQLRDRVQGVRETQPSVVFLRAVLDQTMSVIRPKGFARLQSWLLAPPASVYDYLARADRTATVLAKYRDVNGSVSRVGGPESVSVRQHYYDVIGRAMARIGPAPLDQPFADSVITELDGIAMLLKNPFDSYWAHLQVASKALALQARPVQASLGKPAVVSPLLLLLENPLPARNAQFEDAYWFVNLLFSRRGLPEEVNALIAAYESNPNDLSAVFKCADELAWKRLSSMPSKIRIVLAEGASPLESLRPFKLVLKIDDPVLAESYMVRNVVKYEWRVTFSEKKKLKDGNRGKKVELAPIETGPRVTQYAPFEGDVEVKVTLKWSGKNIEPEAFQASAVENSELSLLRNLDLSELVLLGIIAVVALTTSLPALYFGNASFGSFGDYVAILTWAIGLDQGKNLIQLMKAYPADGPPAAAGS